MLVSLCAVGVDADSPKAVKSWTIASLWRVVRAASLLGPADDLGNGLVKELARRAGAVGVDHAEVARRTVNVVALIPGYAVQHTLAVR